MVFGTKWRFRGISSQASKIQRVVYDITRSNVSVDYLVNHYKLVWQSNRPWTSLAESPSHISFFFSFDSLYSIHAPVASCPVLSHSFSSFPFSCSSSYPLFFSSSLIATWKIDSRTVTHSAQRDPSWEMTVTGRRARIRLEIGSLVGRTMKQWNCYVRGRKDEEPRAPERSPFVRSRVHRWNFSLDCEF